jgi:hypothetical protein
MSYAIARGPDLKNIRMSQASGMVWLWVKAPRASRCLQEVYEQKHTRSTSECRGEERSFG